MSTADGGEGGGIWKRELKEEGGRNKTYRWHTKERHWCQRGSNGKGGEATWPPPPPIQEIMSALLTLWNRFQCYFLCVYKTVNQAPFRMGWGGHKENHPSGWNRGPLTEGHFSTLLPHRHKRCPSDGDVGVGLSDETEAKGQNWAATVLKYLLKPSAEPPLMSLHHSEPLCKTHLGPLNDFYTPGSFPDSHFIQLKSHSTPPPLSNTSDVIWWRKLRADFPNSLTVALFPGLASTKITAGRSSYAGRCPLPRLKSRL